MERQTVAMAFHILSELREHEREFRFLPCLFPIESNTDTFKEAIERLVEKQYIKQGNTGHTITDHGTLYFDRMVKAIGNMLDFDWAERLPRAIARDIRAEQDATDRSNS